MIIELWNKHTEHIGSSQQSDSQDLNKEIVATAPVKEALDSFKFIKLFLDSTFLTIVIFMVIISAVLIYSLMVSDIDERTYEMAMLRALGLRSSSIVYLILMQSIIFAVPGVLAGLIISAIFNVIIR